MFSLAQQTALVTGATGGIGFAIAHALHARGATVILSGTREQVLAEHQAILGQERCHIKSCNLSDPASIQALMDFASEVTGQLDVLVCNAGITRDTLAMRMKDEQFDEVLAINLKATFLLNRAALKPMMKARYGRIINISSVVAVNGNPGQANYAASKAGMIGMSKSIASEVATRNITVNCIAPGFIATPMTDVLNEQQKERIAQAIPVGRIGTVEEIAAAAVFLASKEASYITGHTLHVNGGMVMV